MAWKGKSFFGYILLPVAVDDDDDDDDDDDGCIMHDE